MSKNINDIVRPIYKLNEENERLKTENERLKTENEHLTIEVKQKEEIINLLKDENEKLKRLCKLQRIYRQNK